MFISYLVDFWGMGWVLLAILDKFDKSMLKYQIQNCQNKRDFRRIS